MGIETLLMKKILIPAIIFILVLVAGAWYDVENNIAFILAVGAAFGTVIISIKWNIG